MTGELLYSIVGVLMFGIGLYGVLALANIIKKIMAVNICGIGVFMFLVANAVSADGSTDPVPHAMVLTGIVVAVAGTAMALYLVCMAHSFSTKDKGGGE